MYDEVRNREKIRFVARSSGSNLHFDGPRGKEMLEGQQTEVVKEIFPSHYIVV